MRVPRLIVTGVASGALVLVALFALWEGLRYPTEYDCFFIAESPPEVVADAQRICDDARAREVRESRQFKAIAAGCAVLAVGVVLVGRRGRRSDDSARTTREPVA